MGERSPVPNIDKPLLNDLKVSRHLQDAYHKAFLDAMQSVELMRIVLDSQNVLLGDALKLLGEARDSLWTDNGRGQSITKIDSFLKGFE